MLKVARIHYPALGYEGVGMAMVIYFQGCRNRCSGCHNEGLQDFSGGTEYDFDTLMRPIFIEHDIKWIDSIVLSGGEPLHQDRVELVCFLENLRNRFSKPIWLYTSYIFENVPKAIKRLVDVIVDGPFVALEHTGNLKFRGSKNQRVWNKIADCADGETMWEEMVINDEISG